MAQQKLSKQILESVLSWLLGFSKIIWGELLKIMKNNPRTTFYGFMGTVAITLVAIFPTLLLIIAVSAIVIGGYKILKGLGHL